MKFSPTKSYLATREMFASKTARTEPTVSGSATLADLNNTIGRQQLIIQSLLMLLIEKNVFEKEELAKWIEYVDQLDGRADGKLGVDRAPVKCASCRRTSPATAQRCIYCNAALGDGVLDRRAGQKSE